jgi:hypothetical protein
MHNFEIYFPCTIGGGTHTLLTCGTHVSGAVGGTYMSGGVGGRWDPPDRWGRGEWDPHVRWGKGGGTHM